MLVKQGRRKAPRLPAVSGSPHGAPQVKERDREMGRLMWVKGFLYGPSRRASAGRDYMVLPQGGAHRALTTRSPLPMCRKESRTAMAASERGKTSQPSWQRWQVQCRNLQAELKCCYKKDHDHSVSKGTRVKQVGSWWPGGEEGRVQEGRRGYSEALEAG